MKRLTFLLLLLPVLLVLVILFTQMRWKFSPPRPALTEMATNQPARPASVGDTLAVPVPVGAPLLGETILREYATTNSTPERDLTLVARLMDNSLLLLKSAGHRPLSANEDWAAMWRGENAARERFLPDQHVAINGQGQVIDRWRTPLFFHALGGGRYEVRSAGPDRQLWTPDDLHRNPDGSFRRGEALNPTSLDQPVRQ
jgi:hypothetical protein